MQTPAVRDVVQLLLCSVSDRGPGHCSDQGVHGGHNKVHWRKVRHSGQVPALGMSSASPMHLQLHRALQIWPDSGIGLARGQGSIALC